MFSRIAREYDLLNRLLSLGLDQGWRRATARAVPADARIVVDACAGTGDLAALVRAPGRTVIACDGSEAMLAAGRARHALQATAADAYHLPFADGSVDALTIAFGLRNLHRTDDALAEMARVLRAGGRAIVLELAPPPARGLRAVAHRVFVGRVVPLLARGITRDAGAYRYLARSVLGYEDEARIVARCVGAGLAFRSATRLGGGAVQLIVTEKEGAA